MKKILFILCFLMLNIVEANFTILPVQLEISKGNKIANLRITNESNVPKDFQLIISKLEYSNGKEVYVKTQDLIITPPRFTVQPKKTQLIRISLKNNAKYSTQINGYRVFVRELPHKSIKYNSQVEFVLEFNIPLTILE